MALVFSHRAVTSAEGFPYFTDEPLERASQGSGQLPFQGH